MPVVELLVLGSAGLLAACVSAVAGIGVGLVLLPVLVLYLGIKSAIPILALALVAAATSRVAIYRREVDRRVAAWSILGALPSTAAGAYLFTLAPPVLLTRLLGLLLLGILVGRRLHLRPLPMRRPVAFLPLGIAIGIVSGLASGVGPLLAPFYLSYGLRKGAYVGTVGAMALSMQLTKLAVFGGADLLTPRVLAYGLFLMPLTVLGTLLGKRLMLRISERVFVLLIEGVMLFGGVALLLRG
jgi:hypothetical protein